MGDDIHAILGALERTRRTLSGYQARCPLHEDRIPSLSLTEKNGRVLFKCHAGCSNDDLVEHFKRVGVWRDDYSQSWTIRGTNGNVIAKKHRVDKDGKKRCNWEPSGVRPREMLYLAERTGNGYDRTQPVYVCEGEKDTDAVVSAGLQAVGTVGGASSCPYPETLDCLSGHQVILWPDYDEPGIRHMRDVAAILTNAQTVDVEQLWSGQEMRGQGAADLGDFSNIPVRGGKSLIEVKASGVEAKEVEWLVDGYIPRGMVSIVAGDPGTGKSFLALDWCASASLNDLNSMYMVFEDSPEYTMVPRLDYLSANKDRIVFINGLRDGDHERSFDSSHIALLDQSMGRHSPALLVIDPIQAFTRSGVDVYRDNEVRAIMTPLAKLAGKHNCAVLVVMHLRKPMGSSKRTYVSIHDVRNSGDYVGAARSVLGVVYRSSDEMDQTRIVRHIKCNVGPLRGPFEFSIGTGGYQPFGVPEAG